ncbi:hypothetical protein C2S52_017015 [Perilla frutescens var. hirtella]|nr:hypothetical protein C2S52_017015 [Perilla frutescens var. hirtella]
MAQLERRKILSESSSSPKSQNSPDQPLKVEETYWSSNMSPTGRGVCHAHEHEECPSPCPSHNKKSVLAKVKEGAKKLKYSLSSRRKHIDLHDDHVHVHDHDHDHTHDHITPSWGAILEDDYDDEKDYDPEYLGAPMYESEAAPDCLKETARQHPRAVPVVSEKHRAPNMTKHDTSMITNMTESVSEKLAPACATVSDATHQINTNMISNMTGTVSEKLAPACAAVSDATHQIASKIAGLTVTTPRTQQRAHETSRYSREIAAVPRQEAEVQKMNEDAGNAKQCASSSQTWDKGVSVKEYFLNKLEPGEDERALSQAITEAISPRKSTGEAGVVDKVKEAVTSFFRQEEISNSAPKLAGSTSLHHPAIATTDVPAVVQLNRVASVHAEKPASPHPSSAAPATLNSPTPAQLNRVASVHVRSNSPTPAQLNRAASVHVRSSKMLNMDSSNSSPLIPLSTSALEVYEEETNGKILQPN